MTDYFPSQSFFLKTGSAGSGRNRQKKGKNVMKKKTVSAIALVMAAAMMLTACGGGSAQASPAAQDSQQTEAEKKDDAAEIDAEEPAAEADTADAGLASTVDAAALDDEAAADATLAAADEEDEEVVTNEDAVVLYFSRVGNTDFDEGIDTDTSASVRVDGDGLLQGNAGMIANWIAEEAGCDVVEIVTEEPYPADYNETVDQAKQEQNEGARPALTEDVVDPADYSTIYLAFPNWWGDLPMAMYSFFDTHDFAGKTINVFVTHEGSGFSGIMNTIRELEPDATVNEGLSIQGGSVQDKEQDVRQWVKDNQ
jgi:flavodoxin